jgi:hypothetical protein
MTTTYRVDPFKGAGSRVSLNLGSTESGLAHPAPFPGSFFRSLLELEQVFDELHAAVATERQKQSL